MPIKKLRQTRQVWLLFLGIITVGFFFACEPGGELTVDNRTDGTVTVYSSVVDRDFFGPTVSHGVVQGKAVTKTVGSFVFTSPSKVYRVEIKDDQGHLLLSQDMKLEDFKRINWRITVGP